MRHFLVLLLLVCLLTPILSADEDNKTRDDDTKAAGRIEAAGTVLSMKFRTPPTSVFLKKFWDPRNVLPSFRRF